MSWIKQLDLFETIEQIIGGFIAAALIGFLGRYQNPWFLGGALFMLLGSAFVFEKFTYRLALLVTAVLSLFYFFLGQPALVLFGAIIFGGTVFVGTLMKNPLRGWSAHWLWKLSGLCLLALLTGLLGALSFAGVFLFSYYEVLPVVAPYGPIVNDFLPPAGAIGAIIIIAMATLRQPVGKANYYWLATPVMAFLFCLFFWPSHSYIGMSALTSAALVLTIGAFTSRQTEQTKTRSYASLTNVTMSGALFIGWFWISNTVDSVYRYQLANAITVRKIDHLPTTKNLRLVPYVAAHDYCTQGNLKSFTSLSENPRPMFVKERDGSEKMFWQCLRHPSRFQGHPWTYPGSGIEGLILVDAGSKGRFSTPINVSFIFGEDSPVTKAAFYARNPFSTMQAAVVGRSVDGQYALLIPAVSNVLQWGAMVPELSSVLVVEPNGIMRTMKPEDAAKLFPGVPLYPTSLARRYADAWAHYSSLQENIWDGNIMEISDVESAGSNGYPTWQAFENGIYGVVPFEPIGKDQNPLKANQVGKEQNAPKAGKEQNALKAIGLINPVTGDMDVVYISGEEDSDLKPNATQNDVPGPRQILANVAASHFGLNGLKTVEALLVVSPSGKIYWSTALLQTNQSSHGYALNVIYDSHAKEHADVETGKQIDDFVRENDAKAPLQKSSIVQPKAKQDAHTFKE